MNDDNEIIKLFCDRCKKDKKGTHAELFGDLLSLIILPKIVCKCGGKVCLEFTGEYK